MNESHGCPYCPNGDTVDIPVVRVNELNVSVICRCPVHGEQLHWSNEETFCWCEK